MSYQKIKIELTESNEQKFREIYQFKTNLDNHLIYNCSFEKFINNWIANNLYNNGF